MNASINASSHEVEFENGQWNRSCDGIKFPLQEKYCNFQINCSSIDGVWGVVVVSNIVECPSHSYYTYTIDLRSGKAVK